ncbi:DUF2332 family protein [Kitasatospora sp. NPDC059571]|uniref:DUF2332 family protein n=1 Tax=Kitasatospora sp. NPDC059571 TaxID=3346871 RepID=UPI0036AB20AD
MFELQATACAELGSPLYAALLRRAAADVRAGGPCAQAVAGHEGAPGPGGGAPGPARRGEGAPGGEQHGGAVAVGGRHPGGQVGDPRDGGRLRPHGARDEVRTELVQRHRVQEVEGGRAGRGRRGAAGRAAVGRGGGRCARRAGLPGGHQEAGDGVVDLPALQDLPGAGVVGDAGRGAVPAVRGGRVGGQGADEDGRGEDGGPGGPPGAAVLGGSHGWRPPQPWMPMREWVHWNELLLT